VDLANGKLNGQKAFMSGKLKLKGNMMLATRLDTVLKAAKASAPPPAAEAASSAPESAGGVSAVSAPGFESSAIFEQIKAALVAGSAAEKAQVMKKGNAIFQFDIKNASGSAQSWTLDLKKEGDVVKGSGSSKPDIVISVADKVSILPKSLIFLMPESNLKLKILGLCGSGCW
jgi:3-hydroxyacyl-CoA dehydrogenase/3a,7a,12a-trihydroxy-5b-cholest-24-enoyl-CoA hydratase